MLTSVLVIVFPVVTCPLFGNEGKYVGETFVLVGWLCPGTVFHGPEHALQCGCVGLGLVGRVGREFPGRFGDGLCGGPYPGSTGRPWVGLLFGRCVGLLFGRCVGLYTGLGLEGLGWG